MCEVIEITTILKHKRQLAVDSLHKLEKLAENVNDKGIKQYIGIGIEIIKAGLLFPEDSLNYNKFISKITKVIDAYTSIVKDIIEVEIGIKSTISTSTFKKFDEIINELYNQNPTSNILKQL